MAEQKFRVYSVDEGSVDSVALETGMDAFGTVIHLRSRDDSMCGEGGTHITAYDITVEGELGPYQGTKSQKLSSDRVGRNETERGMFYSFPSPNDSWSERKVSSVHLKTVYEKVQDKVDANEDAKNLESLF